MSKAADLREKSELDLKNLESDLQEQLFKMRFQQSAGALDNPLKLRETRREIARIKTVLNERTAPAGEQSTAE